MTFSLLGMCRRTGQFGAVVATSGPCVGARVPFLASGVGGILTQHRTDPRLGPRGLDLMKSGCSSAEAIESLVASSSSHAWRQLAAIDVNGATFSFSGDSNVPIVSETHGPDCVSIGNILKDKRVTKAMVDAFKDAADLELAERLLLSIEAGEAAGGEGKPLRSTALVVVAEDDLPWVDLRIDASDTPLKDLRKLWCEFAPSAWLYRTWALDPESL